MGWSSQAEVRGGASSIHACGSLLFCGACYSLNSFRFLAASIFLYDFVCIAMHEGLILSLLYKATFDAFRLIESQSTSVTNAILPTADIIDDELAL